jgi:hypothetical protein
VLSYIKSRVVKLRPGRRESVEAEGCGVADRIQGKLKPRGEVEETPGTSKVTRGFLFAEILRFAQNDKHLYRMTRHS